MVVGDKFQAAAAYASAKSFQYQLNKRSGWFRTSSDLAVK
jgi:hypothetical protein